LLRTPDFSPNCSAFRALRAGNKDIMETANEERVKEEETEATRSRPAPIDEDVEGELNAALPEPRPEDEEESSPEGT
jgi:hypothetical protein